MNNEAFKRFLKDNDISYRGFAEYCNSGVEISKSTVDRLTKPNGDVTVRHWHRVLPTLIDHCRRWMLEHGWPAAEITQVLQEIFEEDYEPMFTERSNLTPDMLEFFELDRDPSTAANDPRSPEQVLMTKELDRIARIVETAVYHQDFVCVLGPIGSGKTTLKNRIADNLRKKGKTHLIFPKFVEMGKLNAGGIVHYMVEEFGQRGRMRLPLAQVQLEKHLRAIVDRGENVTMIIDEIHRLSDPTFTALKNFLELGTGGFQRFLSIVGFGQPRFRKEKMENVEFREIAERLQILDMPSTAKYAKEYIAHRVAQAGGNADRLFEPAVIKEIATLANTALSIGNLANRGLIEAYQKGDARVTVRHLIKDQEPTTTKLRSVAGGRS